MGVEVEIADPVQDEAGGSSCHTTCLEFCWLLCLSCFRRRIPTEIDNEIISLFLTITRDTLIFDTRELPFGGGVLYLPGNTLDVLSLCV